MLPSTMGFCFARSLEIVMKAFLIFKSSSLPSNSLKCLYGHKLSKLRSDCGEYESFFDDEYLKSFCLSFDDVVGNEFLSYGPSLDDIKPFHYRHINLMDIKMFDKITLGALSKIYSLELSHGSLWNGSLILYILSGGGCGEKWQLLVNSWNNKGWNFNPEHNHIKEALRHENDSADGFIASNESRQF